MAETTPRGFEATSSRPPSRRLRVLILAYACDPERGSEVAAGWGITRTVGEFADFVALVGPEHEPAIRRWRERTGDEGGHYVVVPEPWWGPMANRTRIGRFLTYLAWLRQAYRVGLELHAREPFDVALHATYSVYWLPSPVGRFGIPAVWGPVGGAVTTPRPLLRVLGWKGLLGEAFDWAAVRLAALWPGTRRTWREAAVIIVQNEETLRRLPTDLRQSAMVLNHVLFLEPPQPPGAAAPPDPDRLVYVSPLVARKGPALVLRALARTPAHVRLDVLGDGPERPALERLAHRLGLAGRIQFLGRIPRPEVMRHLRSASAAICTGLREEGGCSLAEAMHLGTPVIVLAHGGARTIAGAGTDRARISLVEPADVATTADRLAAAILRHVSAVDRVPRTPLLDKQMAQQLLRAALTRAGSADRSIRTRRLTTRHDTTRPAPGAPHAHAGPVGR